MAEPGTTAASAWDRVDAVLKVIGAGAAIAGWITVVGGAEKWARLHAAGFAATTLVAHISKTELFATGLATLILPLLAAGFVALSIRNSQSKWERAGYPAWSIDAFDPSTGDRELWLASPRAASARSEWRGLPDPKPTEPEFLDARFDAEWETWRETASRRRNARKTVPGIVRDIYDVHGVLVLLLLAALALAGIVVSLWFVISVRATFLLVILPVLFAGLGTIAVLAARPDGRVGASIAVFAGTAVWAGALGFLHDFGARYPRYDLGAVIRKSESQPVAGFFVSRDGDDVYIAQRLRERRFRIVLVPGEDVKTVVFGPSQKLSRGAQLLANGLAQHEADLEREPAACTQPSGGGAAAGGTAAGTTTTSGETAAPPPSQSTTTAGSGGCGAPR